MLPISLLWVFYVITYSCVRLFISCVCLTGHREWNTVTPVKYKHFSNVPYLNLIYFNCVKIAKSQLINCLLLISGQNISMINPLRPCNTCVHKKLAIVSSYGGFSPLRQHVIWVNADVVLIGLSGTICCVVQMKINEYFLYDIYEFEVSSGPWLCFVPTWMCRND